MKKNASATNGIAGGMGLLLTLSAGVALGANHLSAGQKAYEAGQYTAAFELFRAHAGRGDAWASYRISGLYIGDQPEPDLMADKE